MMWNLISQVAAPSTSRGHFLESLTNKGIDWIIDTGPRIAGAVLFFMVAWMVSSWASKVTLRAMTRAEVDVTLTRFVGTSVRWVIIVVAAVAGLGIFGVQTASFTALIGSAGLAIGLAMQGSLSNFAAGVMLLIFRPFRVGDFVTVAGQVGKVDELTLFSTHIDTADNRRIIIPNGQVFGAVIENQTHHANRVVMITVNIDPLRNVDEVRAVLLEAAISVPGRLETPAPAANLVKFLPGAMEWTVAVWAPTSSLASVQQELAKSVKSAMDRGALYAPPPATVLRLPAGVSISSDSTRA
ncbi:MAG: mechanosensitive ion channel family protein [Phycisphaerales bacterium]|jgi:small conductance mechanosensitive channel